MIRGTKQSFFCILSAFVVLISQLKAEDFGGGSVHVESTNHSLTASSTEQENPSPELAELAHSALNDVETDEWGAKKWNFHGRDLEADQIETIDDWELMEVVQTLTNRYWRLTEIRERRQEWKDALTRMLKSDSMMHMNHESAPFDPRLIRWDPGIVQIQDSDGAWTLHLDRRAIRQSDVPTLSPLEVAQAYLLLTGRTYPIDFIMDHIDEMKAVLQIEPNQLLAQAH